RRADLRDTSTDPPEGDRHEQDAAHEHWLPLDQRASIQPLGSRILLNPGDRRSFPFDGQTTGVKRLRHQGVIAQKQKDALLRLGTGRVYRKLRAHQTPGSLLLRFVVQRTGIDTGSSGLSRMAGVNKMAAIREEEGMAMECLLRFDLGECSSLPA